MLILSHVLAQEFVLQFMHIITPFLLTVNQFFQQLKQETIIVKTYETNSILCQLQELDISSNLESD